MLYIYPYPRVDLGHGYLEEEGVQVGEDVPLKRQDGGEVGEQQEGGQASQGHSQQGQQQVDHCTHLHLEMVEFFKNLIQKIII